MTLYLTETTDANDVVAAAKAGIVHAVKLYPAGATTNSASGVRDFDKVRPVLEAMAEIGMPLCIHGEVTEPSVDIFDREAVFIDRVLRPLRAAVPEVYLFALSWSHPWRKDYSIKPLLKQEPVTGRGGQVLPSTD